LFFLKVSRGSNFGPFFWCVCTWWCEGEFWGVEARSVRARTSISLLKSLCRSLSLSISPNFLSSALCHDFLCAFFCLDCCARECELLYSPVCGTDGHTYSNRCFMDVETCVSGNTINFACNGSCPCNGELWLEVLTWWWLCWWLL
jgi:hypothetical protein